MSYRLLLVDDDLDYIQILDTYLKAHQIQLKAVTSFQEAKDVMENNEKFDLVILDVYLPDQPGMDLITPFKNYDRDMPIIMVTAQSDTSKIVEAIQSGASDYVIKPVDFSALYAKIKNLLDVRELKLTEQLLATSTHSKIVGQSRAIKNLIHEISKVAHSDSPVLLYGESGTGKSLLAEIIHEYSPRSLNPFVTVNSAAIPSNLLESEFFGHERGAFTGAIREKIGKFEYANRGTIFLDEIGDLALDLQAKLLRVLQGNEFERVGGLKTIHVDVRVIAATNRDLEILIQNRKFREDLYYRLNVLPIYVPPLRDRKEDVPVLVNYFINYFSEKAEKHFDKVSESIIQMMMNYTWPGNIRELQNVIERAVVLGKPPKLSTSDFMIRSLSTVADIGSNVSTQSVANLKEFEKNALIQALKESGGNVSHTAKILKISRDTVYRRLKKYHIGLKR